MTLNKENKEVNIVDANPDNSYKTKKKFTGSYTSSQLLVYLLPNGKEQEVHKCIHPKHFRVSGIKISDVVTKETSQTLLQTLWYLGKPQINVVSL